MKTLHAGIRTGRYSSVCTPESRSVGTSKTVPVLLHVHTDRTVNVENRTDWRMTNAIWINSDQVTHIVPRPETPPSLAHE